MQRYGTRNCGIVSASSRINDVDKFLPLLVRSGLVSRDDLDSVVKSYRDEFLPSHHCHDTITALSTFLVCSGVVTCWQCDMLRRGKYKGFYLDHYVVLDSLGHDADYSYFLARDSTTGEHARIALTPKARSKSSGIEYHVADRPV
jgi:hypothetical protein